MFADIANSLFTMGVPVAEKAIRTIAVYGGLVVLLRLAGKREFAQLNSFDFVVLLLLSNVVQNAVIGPDNSLSGGLLGAVILVAGNAFFVRTVSQNRAVLQALEGSPTVLVRDGEIDMAAVRRLGLRPADVKAAIRRQGASELAEVEQAALEPGGAILVHLHEDAMDATRSDIARLEAKLDELLRKV